MKEIETKVAPCHGILEVEWISLRCWKTKLRYDRHIDMIAIVESIRKLSLSYII